MSFGWNDESWEEQRWRGLAEAASKRERQPKGGRIEAFDFRQ